MKYKLNLKYKLITAKEIRNWTVLAGLALGFFGCMMVWRSTRHTPEHIEQLASVETFYLAPDTYLLNAVEVDSAKQWRIRSEIVFKAPAHFKDQEKPITIDLYDPAYAGLPWLYTAFYAILTLIILSVLMYLYRFVNRILPGDPFEQNNILNLARAGYALSMVSFFYFIGNLAINAVLSAVYNIHTENYQLRYDGILLIFLIGMAGMVIQLLVRLAIKGNEIQNEQNLTV